MKKLVKIYLGFLFFTMFLVLKINAQIGEEKTLFDVNNQIELKGSSESREVQVEVTEQGCLFKLRLDGDIQQGSLKVEIFDNNGKKRGSFTTGIQNEDNIVKPDKNLIKDNYEERISGGIMQKNATTGVWTVKIFPKNAYGRLRLLFTQNPKP